MDKPRPGGSRDETRNTINMTREELSAFIEILTVKHSPKFSVTQPSQPLIFYGDDDGRAE